MLGAALTDAGVDPTVIVGATCAQLGAGCLAPTGPGVGFRLGSEVIPRGDWRGKPGVLVAEACEFNRSFHNYRPVLASISSVEADHLDVYGTFDEVIKAFHQFAEQVAPAAAGGRLLIAHERAQRTHVAAGLACQVETIGYSPEADWQVGYDGHTRRVTLSHKGTEVADWGMTLPGAHNAMNAATACVLAHYAGADLGLVTRSLAAFRGVDRRMQVWASARCRAAPFACTTTTGTTRRRSRPRSAPCASTNGRRTAAES
jgi:UDP-N-acetylmuramate--alanine ligase